MRKVVYWPLRIIGWFLVTASAIVAATLKTNPEKLSGWGFLQKLLVSIQENAWIILTISILLIPLLRGLQSWIGIPWVWDVIRYNLNAIRDHVFEKQKGGPHHHRVTLFKYVKRGWRRRGWLEPVARSGDTKQSTKVRFRAPEDSPDDAEGIAGQTWARRNVLTVDELPDISQNVERVASGRQPESVIFTTVKGLFSQNTEADVLAKYARQTFVTVEWLRENKETSPARSFAGIPVEVRGKLWGVIVLDSRSEKSPFGRSPEKTYRLFGRQLGKLLEKA